MRQAILIGVPAYRDENFHDIRPAYTSATGLRGLLGDREPGARTPIHLDPEFSDDFWRTLEDAVADPDVDSLLVYFCGHGYYRESLHHHDPDDLFLVLRGAEYTHPEHASISVRKLLGNLNAAMGAGRLSELTLILDCCYGGNASLIAGPLPWPKPFAILTACPVGRRVRIQRPAVEGRDDSPTWFTSHLLDVLSAGATDGYRVTAAEAAAYIDARMKADLWKTEVGDDWVPFSTFSNGGGDIALRRGAVRPGPPEAGPAASGERNSSDASPGRTEANPVPPSAPPDPPSVPEQEPEPEPKPEQESKPELEPDPEPGPEPEPKPEQEPEQGPEPDHRWRRAWEFAAGTWPRRAATALVVLAVAAASWLGPDLAAGTGPFAGACPVPVALRIMTSVDNISALQSAADAYASSGANRAADGCRRSTLVLYPASTDQAVHSFGNLTAWEQGPSPGASAAPDEAFEPLRDVGPRPDVWIPDSSAEYQQVVTSLRATAGSGDALRLLRKAQRTSIGSSPLIMTLPGDVDHNLNLGPNPTWRQVFRQLSPKTGTVLRPLPTTSGTGLLQARNEYDNALAPTDVAGRRDLERGYALSDRQADGALAVLCRPGATRYPALASLLALQEAVDAHGSTCRDGYQTVSPGANYVAPSGGPALDLPFVQVPEEGTDSSARADAVGHFRDWLTATGADGGRAVLAGFGIRAPDPAAAPPADTAATTSAQYRSAHAPGFVLVILDNSDSMWDEGKMQDAQAAIRTAVNRAGPDDRFELWPVNGANTGSPPLPVGSDSGRQAVQDRLKALRSGGRDARIFHLVTRGLGFARQQEQPYRSIVVISDGDNASTSSDLADMAPQLKPDVPVTVFSMRRGSEGACGKQENLAVINPKACTPRPSSAAVLGTELGNVFAKTWEGGDVQ
ncbi:hypothetical protein BIV57_06315 [Mangrovactinospora gilvigrisea]|uniref:VWFA domain-containing protein n=1 Tax=Mangrovactinospora gilvigrisea TaxID=1428644 RepID=A0A1J7BHY3_9ACTN|nr:vWA domain-containing protein [Mangrovactinospora gilvigrisea]OIV38279.1 hypothetical protein BIV57_06315 [Mangrovactinospora gilvigrisea]